MTKKAITAMMIAAKAVLSCSDGIAMGVYSELHNDGLSTAMIYLDGYESVATNEQALGAQPRKLRDPEMFLVRCPKVWKYNSRL